MKHHCKHQWVECTVHLREILIHSEYGGWQVSEFEYFVCANCLVIEARPAQPFEIISGVFAYCRVEEKPKDWQSVA